MGRVRTALECMGRLVPYLGEYLNCHLGDSSEKIEGFHSTYIAINGTCRSYLVAISFLSPSLSPVGVIGYTVVTGSEFLFDRLRKKNLERLVSTPNNNPT